MYILLFKPIIHKNIFKPLKWVIMLFTLSKYNHMAMFFEDKVCEFKGHGFQEIDLKECLKESKSKIHAYKFTASFDERKLRALIQSMYHMKYDVIAAIESEASWISWFFKKKKDGIFCNRVETIFIKDNGYLPKDFDTNRYSPQELLNKMLKLKLIDPVYEVWK
jgi:hypothetical protein